MLEFRVEEGTELGGEADGGDLHIVGHVVNLQLLDLRGHCCLALSVTCSELIEEHFH